MRTEIKDKGGYDSYYLLALFPLHARAVYGVRQVSPAEQSTSKAITDMYLELQRL